MTPYYEDDFATIYHGDCREMFAVLIADVLVTDPPYGMRLRSGKGGRHGDNRVVGDDDTLARDAVLDWWGDHPALVFGRWSVPRPKGTRMILTWDKGGQFGMGDLSLPWKPNTEEIYVIGRGFTGRRTGAVLRHLAPVTALDHLRTDHPTQKSLPLMRELIDKCPPGVVLDPFAGSGTTLRAAKDCGRKAIGVEMVEAYCEIAAKRLAQEVLDFGGVA